MENLDSRSGVGKIQLSADSARNSGPVELVFGKPPASLRTGRDILASTRLMASPQGVSARWDGDLPGRCQVAENTESV